MIIELSFDEYIQATPLLFNSDGNYLNPTDIFVLPPPGWRIYFKLTDDAFAFAELLGLDKNRIKVR